MKKKMNKWLGALIGLLLLWMTTFGAILIISDNPIHKAIGIGLFIVITAMYIYITRTYLPAGYNSEANKAVENSSSRSNDSDDSDFTFVNPASGGLMIGGMGGIDTFGNSFGSNTCGGCND